MEAHPLQFLSDIFAKALHRADGLERRDVALWGRARSLAIRGVALLASASAQNARLHTTFFTSVLGHFAPKASAADDVMEQCVLFLLDAALLYGGRGSVAQA